MLLRSKLLEILEWPVCSAPDAGGSARKPALKVI
jgi:hypothetical protein